MAGETELDLDFETGTWSKWPALQGKNGSISRQFQVVQSPVLADWGGYSGRTEVTTGDSWVDGSYRALACNYDTHERLGQTYYFAFGIWLASNIPDSRLLAELHHPNVVSTKTGYTLAPHAIHTRTGGLHLRTVGGFAGQNVGYPYWYPNQPIPGYETSKPVQQWILFILGIKFQEQSTYDGNTPGWVKLWVVDEDPGLFDVNTPLIEHASAPTLPWWQGTEGGSFVAYHDQPLYWCIGIYPGTNNPSSAEVVFHTGVRRRLTFADAVTAFGGFLPDPPPPSSEPHISLWTPSKAVLATVDTPQVFPDAHTTLWTPTKAVDVSQDAAVEQPWDPSGCVPQTPIIPIIS